MKKDIVVEVCVDSIQSAIAAQNGGANRLELCDNLGAGGITPSAASIELTRRYTDIDINVIIRPRPGDFCYTKLAFEVMKRDAEIAKEMGINGIVVGILTPDGEVDTERMKEIIEIARPLSVTFHRAFDMARDPLKALNTLIDLKVDRILTSGQKKSAVEGLGLLGELVKEAKEKIIIMPGGGINPENVDKILSISGIKELHLSGKKRVESMMRYRNESVSMGGNKESSEYENYYTDENVIRLLRNKCDLL
ncbi:copper homeostasis protein CutC [Wukongibacter baidiensis]|uniref:copper homeostasis protein CutC n=1 Tax=Wukongibacter baidiensis TaxID=1723361 RepID=UPI003D7F4C2D